MRYRIVHENKFFYETDVDQSLNYMRLKPRTDECQRLLSYQLEIEPASMTRESVDIWGNNVETFFIPEKHRELHVTTTSEVSIQKTPFIQSVPYKKEMQEIFHSPLFKKHYLAFLKSTPYTFLNDNQVEEMKQLLGPVENPAEYAVSVMNFINGNFDYNTETTDVSTTASDSLLQRSGVCQDYTHVMLGLLRSSGIPARYVSGYLYIGEESAMIGDAASHAWVEVMIPGVGWCGLDPTNNVEALENHVIISTGRDYADLSPFEGVYRGGGQTMEVNVSCTLLEDY
ncbi:transglutaminase family protein [Alkalicoccus luteus]|uniref:Transglutaminase family protein n=1 Tax=Alkalicoccus luteus TaxID=1237094 RepID=A0A969TXU7_9BACI|nr:transglutaminase family protein [Alkalicoccus luteus]NJP38544.1 transglutaminase family protein [Alkalicoccus luteus]